MMGHTAWRDIKAAQVSEIENREGSDAHARTAVAIDVGMQLYELRSFLGISQRELARASNLTADVVEMLETGGSGLDDAVPIRAVTDALAEYVRVTRSSDSALRLAEIRALESSTDRSHP